MAIGGTHLVVTEVVQVRGSLLLTQIQIQFFIFNLIVEKNKVGDSMFVISTELSAFDGSLIYDESDVSIRFEPNPLKPYPLTDCSLSINPLEIRISSLNGQVKYIDGYFSTRGCEFQTLCPPDSVKGAVFLNSSDCLDSGETVSLEGHWSYYYDPNNGWICIGEKDILRRYQAVEIVPNTIMVFEKSELKSVWLKP